MSRGRGAVGVALVAGILAGCKDPPKDPAPTTTSASAAPSVSAAPSASAGPSASETHYDQDKVKKILNPSGMVPYAGPTGSVEGTISVRGAPAPATTGKRSDFSRCPRASETFGKLFREGEPVGAGRALADAIVAVTGYEGFVPAKRDHVDLRFDECAYDRRTVVVTFGERIDVYNGSKKEIVTPDLEGQPVLALRIAAPRSISPVHVFPPNPGRFHLIDRGVISYIDVDVYALMHPLHASSDLKGKYRIDGIPVGKATVNVAHPAFGGDAAKEITVAANVVQTVDLVLSYGEDAGAPKGTGKDAGKVEPAPLH